MYWRYERYFRHVHFSFRKSAHDVCINMKSFFTTWPVRIVGIIIAIFVIYTAIRAYDRRTDGFAIEKIHSTLPYDSRWDVPVTKEDMALLQKSVDQPFYYLAKGFQCYAFESADGKYVLKFFRHQRLRLPSFFKGLPDIAYLRDWRERREKELGLRLKYLFTGMKVGFEGAREETALLFVHLNKTNAIQKKIKIIDRLGSTYVVDLDQVEFLLQRKAQLVKPTLQRLMAEGKENEAQERIAQIFVLVERCAKKGIQDTDGALIRKDNLGFLEDRAIYIDSGKLAYKESIKTKEGFTKDLKRLRPLYKWLAQNYPSLATYFEQEKQRAIDAF